MISIFLLPGLPVAGSGPVRTYALILSCCSYPCLPLLSFSLLLPFWCSYPFSLLLSLFSVLIPFWKESGPVCSFLRSYFSRKITFLRIIIFTRYFILCMGTLFCIFPLKATLLPFLKNFPALFFSWTPLCFANFSLETEIFRIIFISS